MSVQFSSVTQSCPTLCNPIDCSTPGFHAHHQLLGLAQTHVRQVSDAIQPSHPLSSPTLHIFKAIVFPLVMCGCESKTVKRVECRRIDAFKLWCWRKTLESPSAARRSVQSILKEIHPEYSLEGLVLKLKLQYFDHLI